MHFLADVYVPCDVCKGRRYNRETLEIRFKGRNIQEVLDMTVEEALPFFAAVPTVQPKLQTLLDVGLSYVRLGQSATTLSGGEAQRVKLSKELSKRATGRTLYILDEPTTGLHFADIAQLLAVLHRLRDEGNTIIVIEHNLDVIKTADWVVDMGPEGGGRRRPGDCGRHAGTNCRESALLHGPLPAGHPGAAEDAGPAGDAATADDAGAAQARMNSQWRLFLAALGWVTRSIPVTHGRRWRNAAPGQPFRSRGRRLHRIHRRRGLLGGCTDLAYQHRRGPLHVGREPDDDAGAAAAGAPSTGCSCCSSSTTH